MAMLLKLFGIPAGLMLLESKVLLPKLTELGIAGPAPGAPYINKLYAATLLV